MTPRDSQVFADGANLVRLIHVVVGTNASTRPLGDFQLGSGVGEHALGKQALTVQPADLDPLRVRQLELSA